MFNWLKRDKHVHEFSQWQVIERFSNNRGEYLIIQERRCTTCGFTELNRKFVG